MSAVTTPAEREQDDPDVTAQVVIDAMRFSLGAQPDRWQRLRTLEGLLALAPATEDDKGIELIRHLIVDGRLTVQVVA